jgi:hypothetical protein
MENNSDKIIREKLAGLQPPFEPAAWQQMEAMLNKKEKPKGFLFWWLGAIAVLLATGIVLYSVLTVDNEQLSMNNEQLTTESTPDSYRDRSPQSTENKSETKNEKPKTISNEQSASEKTTPNNLNTENNKPTPIAIETKNEKPITINQKQKTLNDKLTASGDNNTEATSRKSSSAMNKTKKNSRNNAESSSNNTNDLLALNTAALVAETPNTFQQTTTHEIPAVTVAENNTTVTENTVVPATETTTPTPENAAEPTPTVIAEAAAVSEDSISNKEEKQPKEAVEKILKSANKFHYSLGVAATLTAAVTKATLAPKPSYSVGFVNEFLFVNRVALSFGFNYAETSYKMYNPKVNITNPMPVELKAYIKELSIPIGIKAYPVSNPKFRYYVSTGIINHIKLHENFIYKMSVTDTASNPNQPQTASDPAFNYVPQQTNFGSTAAEALFDSNNFTGGANNSNVIANNEFSLNNAQRYYTSFYAATGVEFIIKNRFLLFAETLYFTNIQQLGIQDKRKHNIGMGTGLRVQF